MVGGHVDRSELFARPRDVGARPNADDQPSLRDTVQGREGVRELDRPAEQRKQHRGAEAHPLGRALDCSQHGDRLTTLTSQQSLTRTQRLVA